MDILLSIWTHLSTWVLFLMTPFPSITMCTMWGWRYLRYSDVLLDKTFTYTRSRLYRAMVLPVLDYCDAVWHECWQGNSDKMEQLQRRAARICYFKSASKLSTGQIMTKLGIFIKMRFIVVAFNKPWKISPALSYMLKSVLICACQNFHMHRIYYACEIWGSHTWQNCITCVTHVIKGMDKFTHMTKMFDMYYKISRACQKAHMHVKCWCGEVVFLPTLISHGSLFSHPFHMSFTHIALSMWPYRLRSKWLPVFQRESIWASVSLEFRPDLLGPMVDTVAVKCCPFWPDKK